MLEFSKMLSLSWCCSDLFSSLCQALPLKRKRPANDLWTWARKPWICWIPTFMLQCRRWSITSWGGYITVAIMPGEARWIYLTTGGKAFFSTAKVRRGWVKWCSSRCSTWLHGWRGDRLYTSLRVHCGNYYIHATWAPAHRCFTLAWSSFLTLCQQREAWKQHEATADLRYVRSKELQVCKVSLPLLIAFSSPFRQTWLATWGETGYTSGRRRFSQTPRGLEVAVGSTMLECCMGGVFTGAVQRLL